MKHNNFLSRLTHFVANGRVSTPPCNSHSFLRVFTDGRPTVEYAVQHTLRYAFLLLTFLLLTPSNMWGGAYNGKLYIIGQNLKCDWSIGSAYDFVNLGNGIYEWKGKLVNNDGDGFKLPTQTNWNPRYMATESKVWVELGTTYSMTKTSDESKDNKFMFNKGDGYYKITVDLSDENNGKLKVESMSTHVSGDYFLAGDFLGGSNWGDYMGNTPKMLNGETSIYWRIPTKFTKGQSTRFKLLNGTKRENWNWNTALQWSNFDQTKCSGSATYDTDGDGRIRVTFTADGYLTMHTDGSKVWATVEGDTPAPTTTDYYVFGAGGTNWVTGWTKKKAEYKLTENDGVYSKTFYNVKGSGLEFKICDQNESEYQWDKFSQAKSNVTCRQNGTNIDFDTKGTKNYEQYWDVTVYFDKTNIWITRELSELGYSSNDFYVMGSGNSWSWDKNTKNDYNHLVKNGGVASATFAVSGNWSFKVFRASDQYEINWDYYNASKSTGTSMINNGDDNIGLNISDKQLTIYFDGKEIWTDLSTPSSKKLSGTNYFLRGDMWLQEGTSTSWIDLGDGTTPRLVKNSSNTEASCYYVVPKGVYQRIELYVDGTAQSLASTFFQNDGNVPFDTDGSKARMFANNDNARKITFTYKASDEKLHAVAETPNQKTGWYVRYRKTGTDTWTTTAMDDNGEYTLTNLETNTESDKNKYYLQVTDGTSGIHGVNWFGGLYFDMTNSAGVTFKNFKKYYKNPNGGDATSIWPIEGDHQPTGVFYPNSANVKVSFDGGVIKFTAYVPAVTYPVHFNTNGGSSIADVNVAENTPVAKPTNPTKQNKGFAGWYSDEQLQNKYDFSTPVTWEMTLYAKWADPFAQGETIYFFLDDDAHGWTDAGANIRALFYDINDKNKCLNTNNYEYGDDQIGNLDLGVSHFGDGGSPTTNVERIGSSYWYKVIVPYNNAGAIRFVRLSSDPHYMWCYATNKYVGDRDGYPSIRLTTNSNRDSNAEWYNETPCWTVTFDMMGHGEAIAPKQVIKGEKVDKPTNPSADGWKFVNWYKENTFSNVYNFNDAVNNNMTLYAKWEQVKMVTVTFLAADKEFDQQIIEKGGKATKPATDPVKAGYTFTGWDWNLDDPITENKLINAQWALKGVESVTLDKTELTMRVGGTTQKLTPTCAPEDVIGVSYSWEVTSGSAVSVSTTGLVSPLVKGQAVVTCTATNEVGISKTATCSITVKGEDEDCETIGVIYAEKQVSDMTQVGMFTESMNTEPKEYTKVQIKVGNAYAYVDPDDAKIKHGSGTTDYYYWYQIATGTKASCGRDMYLYKNVGNNKYLMKQNTGATNKNWGWDYVITSDFIANDKRYEWYFKDSDDKRLVCNETTNSNSTGYSRYEMFLSRKDIESAPVNTYIVCGSSDSNQGGDVLTTKIDNTSTVDNPNYLYPTVTVEETTYYRFANGAVVSTTLPMEMKAEDTIKVYYYATAATTAELRINGSKVDDIEASVGENIYEYTVKHADAGQMAVAVASNNTAFLMSKIEVVRPTPKDPITPVMNWNPAIDGTITKQVSTEKFTYEAVATKGAGLITYSSNNTDVATVDATTGEVTMIAEGDAVITATMEQEGCYAEGSISYNLHLNDLPKPTIEFTTLPDVDAPQGSVQNIVVTTTGGAGFDLAITSGAAGAELKIGTRTDTRIEATLELGANATNIELTASTERTATLAQNAVKKTITVSACIPDGANIFEFTLTGSDAATGQVAGGVIGGTVDQTALGTVGTEDNPAKADLIKFGFKETSGFAADVDGKAQVVDNISDNANQWYWVPTGEKSSTNEKVYYLVNAKTGKYIYKDKSSYYGNNGGWKYYATRTSGASTDNVYKWFMRDTRLINLDGYNGQLEGSHIMRRYDVDNDGAWTNPCILTGLGGHQGNGPIQYTWTTIQSGADFPYMMKSVQYNEKTYYIISGGSITLRGDFKAGDVVNVDTYDRKTGEADIIEKTISEDATSYTYTTTNAYECVNNIKVWRNQVGEMVNPTLTFAESNVTLDVLQPQTTYTQVATPSVTTIKTITYTTDNEEVATVNEEGQVTLVDFENIKHRTSITVTATMPAVGCYNEATTSYTILVMNLTPTALQTLVDDTEAGGTLTLQDDFDNCDVTISQAITIDAQSHTIGNLTVTTTGDLTLTSAMTANNLYISADQVGHKSGQLKGADKLNLEGTAYMDLSFAGADAVTEGWYAFTVPFKVSSTQGIYNVEEEGATKLTNETDYAIMQYQGNVRAEGKYGWIKTHKMGGMLQPGTLYIIAFGDTDYDMIRFVKASGDLKTKTVAISEFGGGAATDNGWNGVGNPTLAYGNAENTGGATKAQFLNHDAKAFEVSDKLISEQTYIVSSAFFIQASENATMIFNIPSENGALYAPRRAAAEGNSEFMLELSQAGKMHDRFFLSASEEASATYEIGHDLVKMGAIDGAAKVAQVAINGYGMSLCDAEFVLDDNNEAFFPLTITAPKAGEYTLSIKRACENQSIFVMDGNQVVWDLTQGDYTFSVAKGTSSNYGLLLQAAERQMPTDNKQLQINGEGVQKIILHNTLRIIKNGKMYNVLGL